MKTATKTDKKLYELYLVLSPAAANEDGAEDELIKAIENHGGEVKNKERLTKTELAYPMQNTQFAYKGSVYFYIAPENIQGIEEEIKSSEVEIMRWMITATEEKKMRKVRKSPNLEKELEAVEKAVSNSVETKSEEKTKAKEDKNEPAENKKKEKASKDADEAKPTSSIEDIDKKLDEIMGNL